MANIVNYNKRDFLNIRQDLYDFIEQYYPEVLSDFSDSSVGGLLVDLCAAVGDNLSFNTDRAFQETQLGNAQQRKSLFELARNLGVKLPNKRGSVTALEISVNVPAKGDTFDKDYLPIIKTGAQFIGSGVVFENLYDIDFLSPFSATGSPNRRVIPNTNANNIIQSYTITKLEIVYNGRSNITRRVVDANDQPKFFEFLIPDTDVLDIEQVIVLPGTNYTNDPSIVEFFNPENRFYEVDYLAQQYIFEEDFGQSDRTSLKVGKYKRVTKKFIKEFTPNGQCKLTFGNGNPDVDALATAINQVGIANQNFSTLYLENTSLGERVRPNSTIFVRYRSGGGVNTNLGKNIINTIGQVTMVINGPNRDINQRVQRSLVVNNPIPALGGNDGLSIEELRFLISYNYASQRRCVTLNDYLERVFMMSGKFGSPFKLNVFKENNKVVIPILNLGEDGKLSNQSTNILKDNIAEYLKEFRMINDYVEVRDGRVYNLGFEVTLYVDSNLVNQISNDVITEISETFSIFRRNIGENIFLGEMIKNISNINGVINIIDIKAFSKVGGLYSLNEISMPYSNNTTKQIQFVNNSIYTTEDGMIEIKFPERDVKLFLKTDNNFNF